MAHRIYIYNIDFKTKEVYSSYLAEWNYEIPALLLPLFSSHIRSKGTQLYTDKEEGIAKLRNFYSLLADAYELHYKKQYDEPINKMFEFLENLPFDTFQIDGRDVFNMNDEKHTEQAKNWVEEIKEKVLLYDQAIQGQNLDVLQPILQLSGYHTFLEMLQTDWIGYGLGLWEEDVLRDKGSEVYEENGRQGLKDAWGNILTEAIYKEIFEFNDNGIAVVEQDDLYGYINEAGVVLSPCQYEEAFDAKSINGTDYAEVAIGGKWGILHIQANRLSVPAIYDALEWLTRGYLNAKKGESYFLLSVDETAVVTEAAAAPFAYDYNKLFFQRQTGTMKRKYYRMDGRYLGDFLEGSLAPLAGQYFWIKPNKLQPKIAVIKPDGMLLDMDIDRIVVLDDYRSIAYVKDKRWRIYSLEHNIYRLTDLQIDKVLVDSIQQYRKDIFVVVSSEGHGLYDAYRDTWLLRPELSYQKIEHCFLDFIRVRVNSGMYYYDTKTNTLSELYDYICEPLHYPHPENNDGELLLLFQGEKLFYLNLKRNRMQIPETEFGRLYMDKYNLQGHDQNYFVRFYQEWIKRKGQGYESYLDNEILHERGRQLNLDGKIAEAIRVLTIGAERGSADCQYLLGNIYCDNENEEVMDIAKGMSFYTQAMEQQHAPAWNNWGYLYATGHGVDMDIPKALDAYRRAAELGEEQAMSNLGNLYYDGQYVTQDLDLALAYFKQAEKGGISNDAQLAEIYYQKQDYSNLLRYLRRDAEGQYAAIYYGILYEYGLGVKQNMHKAIRYFEQANEDSVYAYAVSRLLFHYGEQGTLTNPDKYTFWLNFAEQNNIDLTE